LILLSCGVSGAQLDFSVKAPSAPIPNAYIIVEWCFTILFFIELLLRMWTYGTDFFSPLNRDWKWNVFDAVLYRFLFFVWFLTGS